MEEYYEAIETPQSRCQVWNGPIQPQSYILDWWLKGRRAQIKEQSQASMAKEKLNQQLNSL